MGHRQGATGTLDVTWAYILSYVPVNNLQEKIFEHMLNSLEQAVYQPCSIIHILSSTGADSGDAVAPPCFTNENNSQPPFSKSLVPI